ncbi:MAG: response regulator transcription factor [Haloglomus sp.]
MPRERCYHVLLRSYRTSEHSERSTPTGTSGRTEPATVLVVEDDPGTAEILSAWLNTRHEVLVAHDGRAALDAMSGDVDVVLLDRRRPRLSGDDFLLELKDAGRDAWVVMVTAVDPGPDIADVPFDDYLTRPVTKDAVLDTLERMLQFWQAGPAVWRYHLLERRRDVLRTARATTGETDSETFELLSRQLEAAARDAGTGLSRLKGEYYATDGTRPEENSISE